MAALNPSGGTLTRILQNASWLFAGKGVGALFSLLYLGIATRSLGIERFGQFALILSIAQAVSTLVAFQTWQILVRFGMPHLQNGERAALRQLTGFMLLLDIGGALAGCLILLAAMHPVGEYLGWPPELRGQAFLFAVVMVLCIRSTAIGILRLHDRFRASAAADTMLPVGRLLGAVVVLLTEVSVPAFLAAWAAAEVLTALVSWILAARCGRDLLTRPSTTAVRHVIRAHPELGRFALFTNASYSLEALTKQFSTVIVGLWISPAAAGQYRLALQIGQGFAKLSDLLSRAVFAELTRVGVAQGPEGMRRLFRRAVVFSASGAAIIILLLLLLGKPALLLVAGPEFAAAAPLVMLLGIAAALDFAGVNFEPALLASGRASTILKVRVVVGLALVGALVVLLPRFEAPGAAAAALLASFIGLLLFGTTAWRTVHRAALS